MFVLLPVCVTVAWWLTACVMVVPSADDPGRRDPLVPTVPARLAVPRGMDLPVEAAAPVPAVGMSAAGAPALPEAYTLRWRMGVAVPDGRSPAPLAWQAPRPGWYLNWSVGYTATVTAPGPAGVDGPAALRRDQLVVPPDAALGMAFVPLVWVHGAEIVPDAEWLAATVALLPGRTWLIGNEPDVKWQSNATPGEYAQAYHAAYMTIKEADPTAQVAMGGLSQITPLRLAYLDAVWAAYHAQQGREMPVDVWTMHAFVLQEAAGAWGVDVPPGLPGAETPPGMAWSIEQHDDLALIEEQVRRMRGWMAAHGQRDKPLWITEYGILMPAEYGFDEERVRRFMLGSFDLFWTLRDVETGYGVDDDRLVQRWVWFSTDDVIYPTGNLFMANGAPGGLYRGMQAYLSEFGERFDLP